MERKRLRPYQRTRKLKGSYDRAQRVMNAAIRMAPREGRSRIESITIHTHGYAEPDYDNPTSGVIACGDWNSVGHWHDAQSKFIDTDFTPCRIAHLFERMGVACEWEDEWMACGCCCKLVRTSGSCHGWQQYYWDNDGDIVCGDCVKADPSDYLESLEGDHRNCITIDLDLQACGYRRIKETFENGLYGGQDAEPGKIAQALRAMKIDRFIFNLDSVGPFDMGFSVWVHKCQKRRFSQRAFEQASVRMEEDPATTCQRYLQNAPLATAPLEERQKTEGGVIVCRMGENGEAKARLVSPQDFIAGKALQEV